MNATDDGEGNPEPRIPGMTGMPLSAPVAESLLRPASLDVPLQEPPEPAAGEYDSPRFTAAREWDFPFPSQYGAPPSAEPSLSAPYADLAGPAASSPLDRPGPGLPWPEPDPARPQPDTAGFDPAPPGPPPFRAGPEQGPTAPPAFPDTARPGSTQQPGMPPPPQPEAARPTQFPATPPPGSPAPAPILAASQRSFPGPSRFPAGPEPVAGERAAGPAGPPPPGPAPAEPPRGPDDQAAGSSDTEGRVAAPAEPPADPLRAWLREYLDALRVRAANASSWLETSVHYARLINRDGVVPVTARFSRDDIEFLGQAREEVLGFAELGLRLVELHSPLDAGGISTDPSSPILRCRSCMWRWPCPTFRMLTEALSRLPNAGAPRTR